MSPQTATAHAADPIALLYPELEQELASTRAMLAIVPWEHAEWKPHPRSGSLRQLSCHVAQAPGFATAIAAMDVLSYDPEAFKPPMIGSTTELLTYFEENAASLRGALSALDWDKLEGNWKMQMGEIVVLNGQRAMMLRHMGINHLVHHRAQLGVYLRLLDVKIPGSYGPSADS